VLGHVPGCSLTPDENAEDVDRHRALEVLEVVLEKALVRSADAGVVHHDVEPTQLFDREVHRTLDLVGVGDIRRLEGGGGAELGGHRLATLGVNVGDGDPRTLRDEPLDDGSAQPTGATGDDRDLSRELLRHPSMPSAHRHTSSIQNSGLVSMPWRSKRPSISARSSSLIDQPTAPTLSSTSATVRQPTSAVLTAGCERAHRSASCGRLLS
jgi:hypothetical protein